MKKIVFTKMEGAGNDFIVIDSVKTNLKKLAIKACSRKIGIGADGLLVLDKSKKADYRMRIINADGSEAEMCGNGVRCMASYIVENKKPKKKRFSIETIAGIILVESNKNIATARLSDPKDYRPDIPIFVNKRTLRVNYIDTGVPHVIVFVSGLENIDVANIGRFVRYHRTFSPRGTNVNFVEQIKTDLIKVRTYERGVEDETCACGTGSVAAAIVSYLKANPRVDTKKKVSMKVLTAGSEILDINFQLIKRRVSDVWLKGKIKFIAKGVYNVE